MQRKPESEPSKLCKRKKVKATADSKKIEKDPVSPKEVKSKAKAKPKAKSTPKAAKAKASPKAKAKASGEDVKRLKPDRNRTGYSSCGTLLLGCSTCRWGVLGCGTCLKPSFGRVRWNRVACEDDWA